MWPNLQELILCVEKCPLKSFALGMREKGNAPKIEEPTIYASFTTMLHHIGRFL
jgi:hypothetical protein